MTTYKYVAGDQRIYHCFVEHTDGCACTVAMRNTQERHVSSWAAAKQTRAELSEALHIYKSPCRARFASYVARVKRMVEA